MSGNSGILLDGLLTIDGGQLDMRGGDNYIEYSASGNAQLNIAADTLFVGSQIRRSLTATEGILKYNQTGGVVILGTDDAPENNRAVLEILNAGSEFNLTDGKLIIARAQDNPEIASLISRSGCFKPGVETWKNTNGMFDYYFQRGNRYLFHD